jgi:Flavoprotein
MDNGQKPVDEHLLIQMVVRVLAMLKSHQASPRKQVLVLFGGASAGWQAGLDAIAMLARDGHLTTVVLTSSAVAILGEGKIREAGASQVILPGVFADAPALVREHDLVLIPTLSMNLAGKLAMGLFDSLLTTLALGALLAGKPVLAVRDGADPDGCGGRVWSATGAAATLRARLTANLKTLESYGIRLVAVDEFVPIVQQYLLASYTPSAQTSASADSRAFVGVGGAASAGPVVAAAVITQADIAHLQEGGLLHIPKGSRLTPLARETANRLRLEVVYD